MRAAIGGFTAVARIYASLCCLALAIPVAADQSPDRRPSAAAGSGQIVFRFEPRIARVELGHDILFRGTFLVNDPGLLARLRVAPLVLQWRVARRGTAVVVLQGEVRIRGPRTPLRAGTRPAEPGEYELVFALPPGPRLWRLRLEHEPRNRIEVYVPVPAAPPYSVPPAPMKPGENS